MSADEDTLLGSLRSGRPGQCHDNLAQATSQTANGLELQLSPDFSFLQRPYPPLGYLEDAFLRYLHIMQHGYDTSSKANSTSFAAASVVTACDVHVIDPRELFPALETDESYSLIVESPRIQLTAHTVFGALRGLESLSQLVSTARTINTTTVTDSPRFQFRAFMIDTSRHYYPINVILQVGTDGTARH